MIGNWKRAHKGTDTHADVFFFYIPDPGVRKSGKNEEDVFSYRVCVFHQGVYLGESTSLPADLRVWNKQWFLLNWGEIWGLKGSQDGT